MALSFPRPRVSLSCSQIPHLLRKEHYILSLGNIRCFYTGFALCLLILKENRVTQTLRVLRERLLVFRDVFRCCRQPLGEQAGAREAKRPPPAWNSSLSFSEARKIDSGVWDARWQAQCGEEVGSKLLKQILSVPGKSRCVMHHTDKNCQKILGP